LQQIETNIDPEAAKWIKLSQSLSEEFDSPINRIGIYMNPVVAALVGIDMPYMNTNSKRKHDVEAPKEVLLKHCSY
jgi:hypothetical protein